MLMKIRSAHLCFVGNLIYFSCTTVSPSPVFQVLGHCELRVLAPGLAWPRSDLLSPARAGSCCADREDTGSAGREQCKAFGSSSAGPLVRFWLGTWAGDPQDGHQPPSLHPGTSLVPQIAPQIAQRSPRGACGKSCFFFQNNPRRVRCQGKGCEEPRRFIAEEILSPARADGRSRNNGRFAT